MNWQFFVGFILFAGNMMGEYRRIGERIIVTIIFSPFALSAIYGRNQIFSEFAKGAIAACVAMIIAGFIEEMRQARLEKHGGIIGTQSNQPTLPTMQKSKSETEPGA